MTLSTNAEMTIEIALELLRREIRVDALVSFDMETEDLACIALPNGWTVSAGFGTRHYCRNYGPADAEIDIMAAPDCEVAIFRPDGSWFMRQVWPSVPARTLLAVVDAAALAHAGDRCPCPDCVSRRLSDPCQYADYAID